MKDIAIYGAGGFGREVASLIKRINRIENQWNFVGFFDDDFRYKSFLCSCENAEIMIR